MTSVSLEMTIMSKELISKKEANMLILSLLYTRNEEVNGKGASEDEIMKVLSWAEHVRIDSALLQNVLDGTLQISISKDGEICYKTSPKGDRRVEDMKIMDKIPTGGKI